MLVECYEHNDLFHRQNTMHTLRGILMRMPEALRDQVLGDELNFERNDPERTRRFEQGREEPDEDYAFRLAKRAVALELYPPGEASEEDQGGALQEEHGEETGGQNEDTSSEEPSEDSDDAGPPPGNPYERAPIRHPRPVLSGNPHEESTSSEESSEESSEISESGRTPPDLWGYPEPSEDQD